MALKEILRHRRTAGHCGKATEGTSSASQGGRMTLVLLMIFGGQQAA